MNKKDKKQLDIEKLLYIIFMIDDMSANIFFLFIYIYIYFFFNYFIKFVAFMPHLVSEFGVIVTYFEKKKEKKNYVFFEHGPFVFIFYLLFF